MNRIYFDKLEVQNQVNYINKKLNEFNKLKKELLELINNKDIILDRKI